MERVAGWTIDDGTVPSDLRDAFSQALARDPAERPGLAELRAAVDAAGPASAVACIEWLDRMFQGLSLMSAVGRHAASAADAQAVRTLVAERRYLAGRPLIGGPGSRPPGIAFRAPNAAVGSVSRWPPSR